MCATRLRNVVTQLWYDPKVNKYEAALRTAAAAVAAAEDELTELKARRNAAIAEAREAGMTWRSIAEAAAMTELGARRAIGYRRL